MDRFDALRPQDLPLPALDVIDGRTSFYIKAYPKLLAVVSDLSDDDHHSGLWTSAHVAYGWMPTALQNINVSSFGPFAKTPIQAIRDARDAPSFVRKLHQEPPINRSWVGTSKTLHFLNPHLFPIWDKNIAAQFG